MPSLGADMEAGTLVEWLKKAGDEVHRGDIVAVVDTQKGAIEVEVFEDGVLERIVVEPGQKVPVGTVLAVIDGAGREAAAEVARMAAEVTPRVEVAGPTLVPAARLTAKRAKAGPPARRRITPAARKASEVLHVHLDGIEGTGPAGEVTLADVEKAGRPAVPVVAPAVDRTGAMRAAIAAAMARSKREIPHFYLAATIDMSRATAWLKAENERRPVTERLLPAVLLLKAVARAMVEVPGLNGYWENGAFRPAEGVNIGVAISLRGGGLVAPALHDVGRKDLQSLMAELRDLVRRARVGSLRSSELADPSITVTNLGDMGVESAFGIIYPPQVALVGFGRVVERPWAVDGKVEVRPLLTATLSADHRAVDGHRAGLFLAAIDRGLQKVDAL